MRNPTFFFLIASSLTIALAARAAETAAPAPDTPPTDLSTLDPAAPEAPTAVNASGDLQKELAENQDKLTTALHSYEILNEENRQLKAEAEKNASDKAALQAEIGELQRSVSFYQAQTAVVGQVDSLRSQLRQTQDQVAALASENADLRTRLALAASPAAGEIVPTRPGTRAAEAWRTLSGPAGASTPPAATPASGSKAEGARTHVVVEGDTLSKISKEYYGTATRWEEILAANRGVIRNENSLAVGTNLTIP